MRNPARTRRRLTWVLAAGLVLLLVGAIALQTGTAFAGRPTLPLALVAAGGLLALPAAVLLTALNLKAMRSPSLGELHDELSARNSLRAMAAGYVAAIVGAGLLGSFAWLERQGDE
jgi:hypothetical protein